MLDKQKKEKPPGHVTLWITELKKLKDFLKSESTSIRWAGELSKKVTKWLIHEYERKWKEEKKNKSFWNKGKGK